MGNIIQSNMRNTYLLRTSASLVSHFTTLTPFVFIKHALVSVLLLCIFLVGVPSSLQAQGPYCPGFNCTANDVQDPVYFLGDATGTPITSISCTPGQPVSGVYLWLTFQVTATNRYDINVIGDIYVDAVYDHTFNVCLGDYNSGVYTVMLEAIVWPCGSEMEVRNTLFAWEVNDDGPPNSCNTCPQQSSKCHGFAVLNVAAPLVANFSYTTSCVAGQPFEVYTFTDQTTNGTLPYSNYVWNFGTGARQHLPPLQALQLRVPLL